MLCFTAAALKTLPLNQAPVWLNSLRFTCIPMLNYTCFASSELLQVG